MQITRTSELSGKINTREINVTAEQLQAWQNGTHIQNAMPNVPAEDREFIMTGITPEEWSETFGQADID